VRAAIWQKREPTQWPGAEQFFRHPAPERGAGSSPRRAGGTRTPSPHPRPLSAPTWPPLRGRSQGGCQLERSLPAGSCSRQIGLLLLPSATTTVGVGVGVSGDLAKTQANSIARGGCRVRHPAAECRAGSSLRAEPRALKRYKSATIGRESRRWLPTLRQSYSGRDSRTGWSVVPWRSIFQRQIPYEVDG